MNFEFLNERSPLVGKRSLICWTYTQSIVLILPNYCEMPGS
ncbi:hypothetical protein [Okeania sp. SIO3I5]|nr:hypothetical protein [Okeania sp. SIO3I5]